MILLLHYFNLLLGAQLKKLQTPQRTQTRQTAKQNHGQNTGGFLYNQVPSRLCYIEDGK